MSALRPSWIVLLLVLTSAGAAAQAATSSVPVFRFVRISQDTIHLGAALGRAARFATSPSEAAVAIPTSEYNRADLLVIQRDSGGVVTSIMFGWGKGRDMATVLASYRVELGAPADSSVESLAGATRTTWRWRDASTEFALSRIEPAVNNIVGVSNLTDLRRASERP